MVSYQESCGVSEVRCHAGKKAKFPHCMVKGESLSLPVPQSFCNVKFYPKQKPRDCSLGKLSVLGKK